MRFNRLVVDHPWVTALLFAAVTAVLGGRISDLHVESDLEAMMPKQHPVFKYNEWVEEYFSIENPILIGVVNSGPDGVFTPETLALIHHLTERLKAMPDIDGEDLVSLSEVDNITGDEEGMNVDPFFETPPATAAEARAVREAVFENDMMVGSLVSRDGTASMIIAEMTAGAVKVEVYRQVQDLVAQAPVRSEQVFIAGRPVMEGEMSTLARTDLTHMFPLVIVAAAVLLGLTLRSLRGAILPLLVVITSVIWTLGLMAWTGATFHAITSLMPTLLIAIGIANGIHVIHHYLLEAAAHPERSGRETTFATMEAMMQPVVLTSLTTAAGFLSLSLSPLRPVQTLGIFTAVGVLAGMVFSLTILPAVLALLPIPRRAAARAVHTQKEHGGVVAGVLDRLAPFVMGWPRLVVVGGVMLVVLSLLGLPRLVVDGSLIQNFPEGNAVKIADATLRARFRGTNPLQIVLNAQEVDGWKDPARLQAVEAFQRHLEAGGHVGRTRSIVDFLKRMNEVMNPEDPQAYRVPDNRDLVAQYLLLYSMSGEPDDFDDVVDYDYAQANIRVRVDTDHSNALKDILADIEEYAREHLEPLGVQTRMAGAARTSFAFMGLIIVGQVRSLIVAIVLCGILTSLMCRARSAGLYAIVPVAVATIVNFGVLAWVGIPLGVTTALISSIAIGIGIDYAIHFMVRYQRASQAGATPEDALRETYSTAGVAISYNALVVLVGFVVLATSEWPPNRALGIVVALNMFICFLGTVTLLAAALYHGRPTFMRPTAAETPSD